MINKRASYRPNLPDLMGLCSANYMLAIKLMADKEHAGEVRDFAVGEHLAYKLAVNEVTRYTTLITIEQFDQLSTGNKSELASVLHPSMLIRLYHDAQMAEVISSQAIRNVKPRYDYPNKTMHLPDEKIQINQFLKEWLQLCLACGRTNAIVNVF